MNGEREAYAGEEDDDVEALIEYWTAAEALAIHDFCQRVCERLWRRHEEALLEHLLGLDRIDGPLEPPPSADERTLPLPLEGPEQPF